MKLFIHFILLVSFFGAELSAQLCERFVKSALRNYVMEQGFKVVPGKEIPYNYPGGFVRLEDARLSIKVQDIGAVAELIGRGAQISPLVISKRLNERLFHGVVEISVVELLPEFAKSRNNTWAKCNGPNCWNASLNWHDPTIGEKFTSPPELEAELATNYRRLKPGEYLHFGDVVVFRAGEKLIHTAIYLDNNLVWHKPGSSKLQPWTLESMVHAVSQYIRVGHTDNLSFFRNKQVESLGFFDSFSVKVHRVYL